MNLQKVGHCQGKVPWLWKWKPLQLILHQSVWGPRRLAPSQPFWATKGLDSCPRPRVSDASTASLWTLRSLFFHLLSVKSSLIPTPKDADVGGFGHRKLYASFVLVSASLCSFLSTLNTCLAAVYPRDGDQQHCSLGSRLLPVWAAPQWASPLVLLRWAGKGGGLGEFTLGLQSGALEGVSGPPCGQPGSTWRAVSSSHLVPWDTGAGVSAMSGPCAPSRVTSGSRRGLCRLGSPLDTTHTFVYWAGASIVSRLHLWHPEHVCRARHKLTFPLSLHLHGMDAVTCH